MAVVGERPSYNLSSGSNNSMSKLAKAFLESANAVLENAGCDLFTDAKRAAMNPAVVAELKRLFVENSFDPTSMNQEQIAEHTKHMNELFITNLQAIKESTPLNDYNPVMGLSFPLHKNILMNCIWDKGIISKDVAVSPKFTLSMERRYLVDTDGNQIDLFKQQRQIKVAMDKVNPFVAVALTLPEVGATDIIAAIGGTRQDHLSIKTHISEVTLTDDTKHAVDITTIPTHGDHGRSVIQDLKFGAVTDTLIFTMKGDKVTVASVGGHIKAVKLMARKDTSNGLVNTPQTKWDTTTKVVEIDVAKPINTTVSPEEIKDVAALYGVDQLAKIMSTIKDIMINYKDDSIVEYLEESFDKLPAEDKIDRSFSFKPPTGYAHDFVLWRRATFMDVIDTQVTNLLNVLHDPNMTVSFVGRPDIIRKIVPTDYQYKSGQSIGPVDLEFERTVVTSDNRVYQFVSSQKETSDEIRIMLNPRNTDRILYKIFDYQFHVSNDIRNAANPTLPGVHAFERWEIVDFQPVQGKITVLDPDGGSVI